MYLVLVRHGQSVYNKANQFCGWTDVDLSQEGIDEAHRAGKLLKEKNFKFDIYYTSVLIRAIHTMNCILEELDVKNPVIKSSWKLNERHYGALQGLNKDESREKYGEEQVRQWRRSASVKPPELTKDDLRYPGFDEKYKDLSEDQLPLTENLLDTVKRVKEYYNDEIKGQLESGKNILISAHGNSLRALVKYLENINDDDIMNFEIPTGKIYVYELDKDLSILKHYFI